jgi:hypothetical protein
MSATATTDTPRCGRPRLRLLRNDWPKTSRAIAEPKHESSESISASEELRSVLVAGGDSCARSHMLAQLRGMLPRGTRFVEAGETWEVVARASNSHMVVLTGDLGDLTAPGLMRVLSRRHPLLPVVALRGGAVNGAAAPCLHDASLP